MVLLPVSKFELSDAFFRLWIAESGMGPWTQISWEGTIFDAEHDGQKKFPIFEHFGKSRNKV